MSRKLRVEMIDRERPKLSVSRQCKLVGVSRSSLYYRPVGSDHEDLDIMAKMDRQYLQTPFYGSRRMRVWLRSQGHEINRSDASESDTNIGQAGKASDAPHRA